MGQGELVYERLREEIVEWELAPGTHLNETRLAERLGVSRTPLREALHRLTRDGLVRISPGRGAFVTEIALRDVVHQFQMREALETHAVRLCARAERRTVFSDLEREFLGWRARFEDGTGGDDADYYALTERLDTAVSEGAANPYLAESLTFVRQHLRRLRRIARRTPDRMALSAREHALICAAVGEGAEDEAARAASAHVNNSLRHILGVMGGGAAPTS
ncbi:GntR family transcriptional regulator [Nocardiopsis sp. L17-MgMaSL7]|uniref:GntR family transcriptional regulator n=1 Tax=Nocardiopsis sp. L17-MgMaSL7 TaxID=1938893 RepID=UPI000D8291F3|nr:GntR family transcriptional regulator [Nocardiopsis sp. L17-MgMaSL7]PWV49243.1 DNA-binding GntR family transcriptional regulator [Nocardiopsis sp. L17-MgMaSL7]